jgi:arabinofuranosyltransferase
LTFGTLIPNLQESGVVMTSHDLAPEARQPWLPGRRAGVRFVLAGRLREVLLAGVPAVVVTVLGWRARWVGDDGMIYTRTVREILAGNGPVFNAGERAEASTGALWQWLLAACSGITGKDPSVVAAALGVLLTGAGYALAVAAARRAVRPLTPAPLLPVGMLVLLAVKADRDYASSGLENGLTTFWIALAWWHLTAARLPARGAAPDRGAGVPDGGGTAAPSGAGAAHRARRGYAAACVIGLGPLVRPELGLVTVVFLAALCAVLRPKPWRAAGMLATAAALPAAYEVFRAGYYGVLVPLPALTKEAGDAVWPRGLAYLGDFTDPYRLWLPLGVLAVVAAQAPRRMLRPELLAPPVAGLLSWLYVCRVGGDFMHGRMLLPGLLLFMLPLCALPLSRLTGAAAALVTAWAVLCALLWRPPASSGTPYLIVDEQRAYTASAGPHPVTELSHARQVTPLLPAELAAENARRPVLLLQTPASGSRFVSLPLAGRPRTRFAGSYPLLGYNGVVTPLDATAVDPLGLAYPLAAHQARPPGSTAGRSGHEKPLDPAWIVADWTGPATPLPRGLDPARVRAARHALTCGRLAELQRSVRAPLTLARFWDNLTGAWSRTGFRFPADPVQAERALCRG